MYAEGYYSMFSDTGLDKLDWESAARGFVGIGDVRGFGSSGASSGSSHGLQVFGFPRSACSTGAAAGASALQKGVAPVILCDLASYTSSLRPHALVA
jgi:hypothetical protein